MLDGLLRSCSEQKKVDNAQKLQIGRMLIKHVVTTHLEFPKPKQNPSCFQPNC